KKKNLASVTRGAITAYINECRKNDIADRSIARKIAALRSYFGFLARRHDIQDPTEDIVTPKMRQLIPRHLTEQEIDLVLETAKSDSSPQGRRNYLMLYLMYSAGLRISELLGVTTDKINFETGFITILGKRDKERLVPLPDAVKKEIDEFIKDKEIFPSGKGGPKFLFHPMGESGSESLSRQSGWTIFKKVLRRAGIKKPVSPHSFRHSLATHLLSRGANIRAIQIFMGHERITSTQIYTHMDKSGLRKIYDKKHPRAG
ncbi:tyrosine-type recombinase/integrase, partial [bacterium]|nr:tyrosine-type recombinase/integrase [bacterium]